MFLKKTPEEKELEKNDPLNAFCFQWRKKQL